MSNVEWELRLGPNKGRMVPKINKVGNQTEVTKTHSVPGNVTAWREEARKVRERNGQISRNLDDTVYFNGSVPFIPNAQSCGTSQEIDYGFNPRGSSTATLYKESLGVTKSRPVVVTLPSKSLEVETDMDVNRKGDGEQRPPLISGRSIASSIEKTVTISKVEKSTEPSEVRANLSKIYDKVFIVDSVPAAKDTVAKLMNQYKHLVHSCDTEVCCIALSILKLSSIQLSCDALFTFCSDYSMLVGVPN